jgi:diguanylate cyclase
MSKQNLNRKTAEEALRFLDRHLLDPTPSNYTFSYLYVTGANGWLRKAVDLMCDGGLRLSQKDVDELMNQAPSESGSVSPSVAMDEVQAELRHQMLAFADVTATALRDTGDFGRDLADNAQQLDNHGEVSAVIRAMIARTAAMETKLAETRRETERLRQDLDAARDDATRDALTSLPNRRAIDRQLASLAEQRTPMTVAFCDIDHFKSINDRFGHAVGDRVLKVVAETLSTTLRPHIVGRFGGEEFVVVLPETDRETAFHLIERAREEIATRHFKVRETDMPLGQVTFSAGIAIVAGDPQDALREADMLLYEAKRAGRNRTVTQVAA